MSDNKNLENDYDSLKDVTEFQNNMFNPGHYIGTGKVPPTVSAPGNALPLAIGYFLGIAVFVLLAVLVICSNSDTTDKVLMAIAMLGLSSLFAILGIRYLKKAKTYRKEKTILENEYVDEETTDELWQRTCPKCGETHDIDYPKCPNCKFNYLE